MNDARCAALRVLFGFERIGNGQDFSADSLKVEVAEEVFFVGLGFAQHGDVFDVGQQVGSVDAGFDLTKGLIAMGTFFTGITDVVFIRRNGIFELVVEVIGATEEEIHIGIVDAFGDSRIQVANGFCFVRITVNGASTEFVGVLRMIRVKRNELGVKRKGLQVSTCCEKSVGFFDELIFIAFLGDGKLSNKHGP